MDLLQEQRVDDCLNVDANRSLSDSWKGFTKFTLMKEKPPKGNMCRRRRLTQIQATTRPENLWSEVWSKNWEKPIRRKRSKNGQTRSQSSSMFEDWEAFISSIQKMVKIKKPSKTQERRWKFQWRRQCLAKRNKEALGFGRLKRRVIESNNIPETTHACIVEAHESTRKRLESYLPKGHEDHIAGKGYTSTSQKKLGTQIYSDASSHENSGCESSSGQGMEKLETIPAWQLVKVKSKKEVILNTKRQTESPLCYIDGHMSSQKCGVGTQIPKNTKDERSVLRCDTAKNDSGAYAVFTEQGSSQMTAAKVMDDIARLPDCELLSCFFFLAVSRPDSSNCHEQDGRCRHHTYLYARRRTFISCAQHSAHFTHCSAFFQCCDIGIGSTYKGSESRISQNHCRLFVMSLLGVPFIRFPLVASSPTCSQSRASASTTSLERIRLNLSAHWSGMSGLANPTLNTDLSEQTCLSISSGWLWCWYVVWNTRCRHNRIWWAFEYDPEHPILFLQTLFSLLDSRSVVSLCTPCFWHCVTSRPALFPLHFPLLHMLCFVQEPVQEQPRLPSLLCLGSSGRTGCDSLLLLSCLSVPPRRYDRCCSLCWSWYSGHHCDPVWPSEVPSKLVTRFYPPPSTAWRLFRSVQQRHQHREIIDRLMYRRSYLSVFARIVIDSSKYPEPSIVIDFNCRSNKSCSAATPQMARLCGQFSLESTSPSTRLDDVAAAHGGNFRTSQAPLPSVASLHFFFCSARVPLKSVLLVHSAPALAACLTPSFGRLGLSFASSGWPQSIVEIHGLVERVLVRSSLACKNFGSTVVILLDERPWLCVITAWLLLTFISIVFWQLSLSWCVACKKRIQMCRFLRRETAVGFAPRPIRGYWKFQSQNV